MTLTEDGFELAPPHSPALFRARHAGGGPVSPVLPHPWLGP